MKVLSLLLGAYNSNKNVLFVSETFILNLKGIKLFKRVTIVSKSTWYFYYFGI